MDILPFYSTVFSGIYNRAHMRRPNGLARIRVRYYSLDEFVDGPGMTLL